MRVILFYPGCYNSTAKEYNVSYLAVNLPQLGLASIAAVLEKNKHEVALFDAASDFTTSEEEWIRRILDFFPDFIGFSTITANFWNAYRICRVIKDKRDTIKTVFGGVHASWGRELLLGSFPAIDYIIAGEGEYSFLRLIRGDAPETIPGLCYRNGETCLAGPVQDKSTLCSMDDLPFPAYNLLQGFPGKYSMPLFCYPRHPGASIISSRGCVYQCSYCDRSVFKQSFRWNSPEYTCELILYLNREYGIKHIMFYDDLFTMNRNRVQTLCHLLRASGKPVSFNCIVRIGHIDSDLIQELKSAGCWMVNVGIESGDQNILDSHKSGLTVQNIRTDVELLYNSGLWVKGLFMMGFPGETEESIKKTMALAYSLPLKDANVTAFTPFPGSPIYENISNFGTFDKDWSNWQNMDCVNFVFIPSETGSKHILEKYYKEFLTGFYNRPFMRSVYRKMVFQSSHSYWRLIKNAPRFFKYAKRLKSG